MLKKILVVIDMQNDFVTGALGSAQAESILPAVAEKIRSFSGEVVFTRDTHGENYLSTQEGKKLPVPHCKKGSEGWMLAPEIAALAQGRKIFDKPTFGSPALMEYLQKEKPDVVELIGVCTDICVISNAVMAKAFLPEAEISVDAACCAGVTEQSHQTALDAMAACQIRCYSSAK